MNKKSVIGIYREYIRENTRYFVISVLFSLRLEPVTSFITYFLLLIVENEFHTSIHRLLGFLLINTMLPLILSLKNLKRMTPYIRCQCNSSDQRKFTVSIFFMNLIFFSLTVTILITIFGEMLAVLTPFDIVRMSLVYLGYEELANNSSLDALFR